MLLLLGSILCLLAAVLLGGRIQNLASIKIRGSWLVFVVLLIQIVLFTRPPKWLNPWVETLHICSYVLMAFVLLANLRLPGMKLIALGAGSNFLVITANYGYMPVPFDHFSGLFPREAAVMAAIGHYNNSAMITEGTRFWWLGDIFFVPRPIPFANVFSVGDVILLVGLFVFFLGIMREKTGRS